jgi:hypothetical protein
MRSAGRPPSCPDRSVTLPGPSAARPWPWARGKPRGRLRAAGSVRNWGLTGWRAARYNHDPGAGSGPNYPINTFNRDDFLADPHRPVLIISGTGASRRIPGGTACAPRNTRQCRVTGLSLGRLKRRRAFREQAPGVEVYTGLRPVIASVVHLVCPEIRGAAAGWIIERELIIPCVPVGASVHAHD